MWFGTLPSRTTGVLAEDGLHIGVYNYLNLEKEPPPSASELIFELEAEAVTSYGSQGKTVDYVLFSDSTIKAATNDQQWYVTISRGRRGIRIFTPDKEQLRENVLRSGQRRLALELSAFARRSSRFPWADSLLHRFGQRITSLIHRARRFHQFNYELEYKHGHKTT